MYVQEHNLSQWFSQQKIAPTSSGNEEVRLVLSTLLGVAGLIHPFIPIKNKTYRSLQDCVRDLVIRWDDRTSKHLRPTFVENSSVALSRPRKRHWSNVEHVASLHCEPFTHHSVSISSYRCTPSRLHVYSYRTARRSPFLHPEWQLLRGTSLI
jgi:hypothetical protein